MSRGIRRKRTPATTAEEPAPSGRPPLARALRTVASVDPSLRRSGPPEGAEWPRIAQAMGALSEAQIYIDDSPNISVMEMRTKARRLKSANNLGLIIVDYLQLMQGRNQENRVQEISDISRSLKGLARELRIPAMACQKLSAEREVRTRFPEEGRFFPSR